MNQRYSELDAIRGIAALMVVLFHYTVRYGQIYGFPVEPLFRFETGQYGVQLFFMISGFVIFLTLDKTDYAVDFILSRFSRLYPAYWAAIILTFSVVSVCSLPGREVNFASAAINLTMIQEWLRVANVDGVYWTLAVELSFYCIMFLLFITKLLKRIEYIASIWLVVILLSKLVENVESIQIYWVVKLFFLLDYGNLFLAGILFCKLMHEEKVVYYAILLCSLVVEYYLQRELVALIAVYYLVFYLFVTHRLKILTAGPLVFFGTISYSLYLIHQNIGYVVINELKSFGIFNPVSGLLMPLLTSVLIASVMQRYIEKPSLRFLRTTWKNSHMRRDLIRRFDPEKLNRRA